MEENKSKMSKNLKEPNLSTNSFENGYIDLLHLCYLLWRKKYIILGVTILITTLFGLGYWKWKSHEVVYEAILLIKIPTEKDINVLMAYSLSEEMKTKFLNQIDVESIPDWAGSESVNKSEMSNLYYLESTSNLIAIKSRNNNKELAKRICDTAFNILKSWYDDRPILDTNRIIIEKLRSQMDSLKNKAIKLRADEEIKSNEQSLEWNIITAMDYLSVSRELQLMEIEYIKELSNTLEKISYRTGISSEGKLSFYLILVFLGTLSLTSAVIFILDIGPKFRKKFEEA